MSEWQRPAVCVLLVGAKLASYCCDKTLTNLKTKGLFGWQVPVTWAHPSETPRQELETTWLKWARISRQKLNTGHGQVLLQHPRTTCLAMVPVAASWALLRQSGKCPTGLPTGWSDENIFLIEILSYQMALACVTLTKKKKQKSPPKTTSKSECCSRFDRRPVTETKHPTSRTLSKCAISLWEEKREWQE